MSYFNSDDQNGNSNEQDYVAKIVQEKGETWKDPQALAKGYLSAQEYIQSIERKNQELLEDLTKSKTREEVLEELRKQNVQPTGRETHTQDSTSTGDGNTSQTSVEDIKSMIVETLTERERSNTAAQNLREADAKLSEKFGTDAASVVDAKAKELGLSKERLTEIASESPTAFLNLIGEPPQAEGNRTPASTVNTQGDSFNRDSNQRDWGYYQKMRRENPKLYYSAKMQRQLDEDYAAGRVQLPH
jgi:hypothetical protein